MRVQTDDEVYRVNAVWLGPPHMTTPWRARYVAYGIWFVSFLLLFTVVRKALMFDMSFFSVAWTALGAVAITRLIVGRVTYDRPATAVIGLFFRETRTPRRSTTRRTGVAGLSQVRMRTQRPMPANPATPPPGGPGTGPTGARPLKPTRAQRRTLKKQRAEQAAQNRYDQAVNCWRSPRVPS